MVMQMGNADNIRIERLTESSDRAAQDLTVLGSQLHTEPCVYTTTELEALLAERNIIMMVARDGERIVGMATLYVIQKVGESISYIEDVVVSEEYRGQGIGERLMRALIGAAQDRDIHYIELTSRPSRIAAHKLYEKLGFKKYETDVFKLEL